MGEGTCLDYCIDLWLIFLVFEKFILSGFYGKNCSKGQRSPIVTPKFDLWFGGHLKLIEGGETSSAIPGFLFYDD